LSSAIGFLFCKFWNRDKLKGFFCLKRLILKHLEMKKIKLYSIYTDEAAALKDIFLDTLQDDWELHISHWGKAGQDGDWGTPAFVELVKKKVAYIIETIKENTDDIIIWSDIDIQFFGKCSDTILKSLSGNDIVFQAERWPAKEINAGFMAIRCNEKTLLFFETVLNFEIEKLRFFEQTAINKILKEQTVDLDWDVLPNQIWAPSHGGFPPSDILLHHANCTEPRIINGKRMGSIERKIMQFKGIRKHLETRRKNAAQTDRGCVFFNFGDAYALRLLVSIFSLRQVYSGPITTILARDDAGAYLKGQLDQLGSEVVFVDQISKSWDRHNLFYKSPYRTTLNFDSDLIFQKPIDELWEPLEREGVLVTRFYPAPYGVDGTAGKPGWANRMQHLEDVSELVDPETYTAAVRRMLDERIDINIGVMGIARPLGDAFLADWAERMERGRVKRIQLMDEMLAVALSAQHRHFLAEEKWNCPADEFFRRTNLADAHVIHYFADGNQVHGILLGRNPRSWAGKKWYKTYQQAARYIDLRRWVRSDPIRQRHPGFA